MTLGWILFRAGTFTDAWDFISRMFTTWGQPSTQVTWLVVVTIAGALAAQFLPPGSA